MGSNPPALSRIQNSKTSLYPLELHLLLVVYSLYDRGSHSTRTPDLDTTSVSPTKPPRSGSQMTIDKKLPLQSSSNANVTKAGKTIEETYQKKTQLEHILLRPDTYVGSIEKHAQNLWIYENNEMVYRSISYVPGLYKIFDEILVNAADNKQRDPSMDSVKVVINVEDNLISVYNNGDGVPVEIHQEEGIYVPEMIFGHLLTSSNYDDTVKKTTGGRNGYGAKLTNIFSTEFVIETADGKRQKKYKQVFQNNMGIKSEPHISKCKSSENWTKVTFKPDLAKFNMTFLEEDTVALMKKRVFDLAGCLGDTVKVELNGQRVPVNSFLDYVGLYLNSAAKSREEPLPRITETVNDRWEVCVSLSEGQFQQVSFVNGIATIKGGTHVDYVTNQITSHIVEIVNKKNKHANVKAHTVKNHLWVFVNSLIDNPAFDSQTKETLTIRQSSFGSSCTLSPNFLKKVSKSGIVEILLSWAEFKKNKELKKTDGTKTGRILGIPKLEDANDAGGRNSEKCTLILTEGDSAKALAMAGISVVGRDHYGVFPLRGKLLNVREANSKQIKENAEIQSIKKILGLQQEKQYENTKSLRYGHLMIMTDQDHDGSHIKGLLINFIHSFWPSLLKIPSFLVEFITPIVKATHKSGKVLSFYTMPEYEEWKRNLGNATGWHIKYYKGLGTSTSKEGKEYFVELDKHKKDFVWSDDQDGEAIELAFSKKKIEARKNWLRQFEPGTFLDQKGKLVRYTDFVNKELILFSLADLQRSIPSMVDGLKPGQRKILFCSFKRNFVKEAKVAQFSGYVSEHSAYHHGEQSLATTIVGMAQDFVGSNNINLLSPNGQFGTRNHGGKDHASPRYLHTNLSPITRFLFPKDDDQLLHYLNEDGQKIEPTWYIPIIPLVLVNGSEGIGTGWSTFVPNYNPRDIVTNIRHLLNDEMMDPMQPWYRGFRGSMEQTATKEGGVTYTVTGVIEQVNETTLRITELPVRRWTQDYKEFLFSMLIGNDKDKTNKGDKIKNINPFIEDIREHSDDANVHFEIILSEENMKVALQEGLYKKFKLTTTISTSNMHLFDAKCVIKKYDNPEQILGDFYHLRLEFYENRKRVMLGNLENELLKLDNKVRFILNVVEGKIIVNNRRRAELFLELKQKGFTPFPKKKTLEEVIDNENEDADSSEDTEVAKGVQASDYEYLLSMAIGTLTLEKVQELCAERDKLNTEVNELRGSSPKSLWLKDLDALEKQLDEQDQKDAEEALRKSKIKVTTTAGARKAPPVPRKNNKKTVKPESAADIMDISATEIENPAGVGKPKARVASKKLPAKKKQVAMDDVEDEVMALKDRLAAYNLDSSPEHSEVMRTAPVALPQQAQKKVATKKSIAAKTVEVTFDSDEDFSMAAKKTQAAGGKKRQPSKNQDQMVGQKLVTDMVKPAAESPEKKVRKMRTSPFNKKSGSFTSYSIEEVSEDEVEITRVRPQRGNRRPATYVLSDSEDEDADDTEASIESDEE
uniref:DNA topoisomerase 2 n=1 Tax=Kalanchoe fedtschenkoi TaxID=63787 RepID=A0A7N0T385_KALFE